jgi:hypothetical protein
MKWVLTALVFFPFAAFAQLPIPITPDWLKGSEKESGVLHSTQVQLFGNNYRMLETNVTAKSGGFKLLGFITIKSPSYVQAMSRLYHKAQVEEGAPQALANLVYETAGMNLILFSLPKIRVRADLVEFTDEPVTAPEERRAARARPPTRHAEASSTTNGADRARVREALRSRLEEENSGSRR